MCDGGVLGLDDKLLKFLFRFNGKPAARVAKDIYWHDIESQRQRQDRMINCTSSVTPLDFVHVVAAVSNTTHARDTFHCESDMSGTVLGPVRVPSIDEQSSMPYA